MSDEHSEQPAPRRSKEALSWHLNTTRKRLLEQAYTAARAYAGDPELPEPTALEIVIRAGIACLTNAPKGSSFF